MTDRELEILEILKKYPLISQNELAKQLMITRSGVATHIHNLTKKGYIKGKGYILNDPNFVTVIGGNNIDILGIPNQNLITNNSNPGRIYHTFGGAARNIAYALTKLNIKNSFITVYGDDLNGEKFISNCKKNNIDTECCKKFANSHTSTFMYIDDSNGQKYIGINDMSIYEKMTPEFIHQYINRINNSLYCILDTNIPKETFNYIYKYVKVPIIIKTTSIQKNYRLIQGNQNIFVLVSTPSELKELLTYYNKSYTDLENAMKYLHSLNIENIISFSVREGIYFSNSKKILRFKKKTSKIVNNAGAVDTLTSILVWGLINELTWTKIMKYAYAGILMSFQSKTPISSELSIYSIIKYEHELFN